MLAAVTALGLMTTWETRGKNLTCGNHSGRTGFISNTKACVLRELKKKKVGCKNIPEAKDDTQRNYKHLNSATCEE